MTSTEHEAAAPTTQPASSTITLIGLPGAGKTSFLAAVWPVIRSTPAGHPLALRVLPATLAYLNRISEQFLRCQSVGRTPRGAAGVIELDVAGFGGEPLKLGLPDFSGELFADAWEHRKFPPIVDRHLRDVSAVILLVHPGDIRPRVTLERANQTARILGAANPDPGLMADSFKTSLVPTQTMLVDLIQSVRARAASRKRRRTAVAVVVSAWDGMEGTGHTPRSWLDAELPLLAQFLANNTDSLPSALFGVSAQGGAWPEESAQLLQALPAQRARCVDEAGVRQGDLAEPIRWALRNA